MTKNLINANRPKLTLIGAGPGALDLITLRGVRALAKANVVMYDALVDKKMLEYAPNAKHIFVGKRKGYKRFSQEELNEMIVHFALNYGNVVRLKGGDSFVFGRGTEEITYSESFGIKTQVVPGISSVMAVPASVGVPVTQRNVARSFWALTGTTSKGLLNKDLKLAAKSSATIIVLMGMSKLNEIVEIFQSNDKGYTPVSIIQNGTTAMEKSGVGTINTISQVVEREGLSSPAIIIIGEVVKHSNQFSEFFNEEINDQTTVK